MSHRSAIFLAGFCLFSWSTLAASALELLPAATLYDAGRQDVCLIGDTLYVASATGLEVFDVSDPGHFRRFAQSIRPDGGVRVAAVGGQAALATGSDSLLIFEVTGTGTCRRVAAFPAMGRIGVLEYYRNHLYFADRVGLRRIPFPISDPPAVDFSEPTGRPVSALAFTGDSLYAVQDNGTTIVFSIAGAPYPLDTTGLRPGTSSLTFLGRFACAAVGDSGVAIHDRAKDFAEVGRFYTYGTATDLWAAGTLLYVADLQRGVLVLAVSDSGKPALVADNDAPDELCAITGQGTMLVAAAANGLFIFDISDPFGVRTIGRQGDDFRVGHLAVEGNLLGAAVEGIGLGLVEITDPATPLVLSGTSFTSPVRGLDLTGNIAGLAAGDAGLLLVDVAKPASPSLLYGQATIGSARDIDLDDSLAIIADGDAGFRIFDVHDPVHARLLGGRSTAAPVIAVARREDFVFAVGPELGIEVYDISFAFKPRRVFAFWPPGISRSITLADQRAFLAVDSAGIFVFDILRPGAPQFLERLDVVHHPRQVVVDGGLVLVADDSSGVVAIDYRAPTAARVIAGVPFGSPPVSMAYAGDALYVSGNSSLYAFAILPPVVPGDVNGDESVALTDVVYLVNYLFRQGPLPFRLSAAEMNGDGRVNLADLVRLIRAVFRL